MRLIRTVAVKKPLGFVALFARLGRHLGWSLPRFFGTYGPLGGTIPVPSFIIQNRFDDCVTDGQSLEHIKHFHLAFGRQMHVER